MAKRLMEAPSEHELIAPFGLARRMVVKHLLHHRSRQTSLYLDPHIDGSNGQRHRLVRVGAHREGAEISGLEKTRQLGFGQIADRQVLNRGSLGRTPIIRRAGGGTILPAPDEHADESKDEECVANSAMHVDLQDWARAIINPLIRPDVNALRVSGPRLRHRPAKKVPAA